MLSEAGHVFDAATVAKAIVAQSTNRVFLISIGLDGWLIKHTQLGLAPVTNATEALQSVLLGGPVRLLAICFSIYFDYIVRTHADKNAKIKSS